MCGRRRRVRQWCLEGLLLYGCVEGLLLLQQRSRDIGRRKERSRSRGASDRIRTRTSQTDRTGRRACFFVRRRRRSSRCSLGGITVFTSLGLTLGLRLFTGLKLAHGLGVVQDHRRGASGIFCLSFVGMMGGGRARAMGANVISDSSPTADADSVLETAPARVDGRAGCAPYGATECVAVPDRPIGF